jgi:hypothetical protein
LKEWAGIPRQEKFSELRQLFCISPFLNVCTILLWLYSLLLGLGRIFNFLIYTQSVGLLGRGISPSQGRYLHTEQHKQNERTQTSMPRVGFESTTLMSERGEDSKCMYTWGNPDVGAHRGQGYKGTRNHFSSFLITLELRIFVIILYIFFIALHFVDPELVKMTIGYGLCHINTKIYIEYNISFT